MKTKHLLFAGWLAAGFLAAAPATNQRSSWVIAGARVADRAGAPLRAAKVRIEGDRIVAVGDFAPRKNETVIRAEGLVLAPGFIDTHNHSTEGLQSEPAATSQVSQGITTVLLGQDGGSPWPIRDYLEARRKNPPAVNVALLVGHGTVRRRVMGENYQRAATGDDIGRMQGLVEQGIREGAIGLSSGLEYVVGSYATTEEMVALARATRRAGGRLHISHIRDEADKSFEALRELIAIAEQSGLPAQITHIKLGTVNVWRKAAAAVKLVEDARRRGLDITADCYPYDAWHSNLKVLVPNRQWDDPASVQRGLDDVGGAGNITVTDYEKDRSYEFRTLEEIARARGITPVALYIEMVKAGDAGVIGKSMVEEDIRAFYAQPWTMVSSDGAIGGRHPRGAGTFPRVLGRVVREWKWLRLEEAIRKMTSLPAARLKLRDRGLIRKGMKADLVLFHPDKVTDNSTFAEPLKLSTGIERVWVNGVLVWDGARSTGARPGRVLP